MMERTLVTLGFDLHQGDSPGDIEECGAWLERHRIPATFFVPTALLADANYRAALRNLQSGPHEFATHSHEHDLAEIAALGGQDRGALHFLTRSRQEFEEFFGHSPRSFRSPAWCPVAGAARRRLEELGYRTDCSTAPQRLGLLSSSPRQNPYLLTPRIPHSIGAGLLEIPTSCFLVPLASPTFLTLRGTASRWFTALFRAEASLRRRAGCVINLMLHVGDLVPRGAPLETPPCGLWDFLPRARGGFGFRYRIRERNRARIAAICSSVVESLQGCEFVTVDQAHRSLVAMGHARPAAQLAA